VADAVDAVDAVDATDARTDDDGTPLPLLHPAAPPETTTRQAMTSNRVRMH